MKISPLALLSGYTFIFLGAVCSDFSVDAAAAELSTSTTAGTIAPSKLKTLLSKLNPRAIYPPAIGRDVAVAYPEKADTGGSHGIDGQVEQNLASRRLLINQDDAAKRVRDAVTIANQAVTTGETSGVALPLDYVRLSEKYGSEQQLTVRLRLPGVDRDQNVLIDTGSSSLAFCNKSLIEEAKNISKTNYAQCKPYVNEGTCPDGRKGYDTAWAGPIFRGDVSAYNDQGEEVASMDNVSFAIMDFEQFYACFGPLDGIIGIAYPAQNQVVELPYPDFNILSLWNEFCPNPNQGRFSQGYETIGICNYGNMTMVTPNPPLEQTLEQDYNSGQITAAAFGLYLDYSATIGSKVDTIVPSLGIYFGGNVAYDNQFYNSGNGYAAKTPSCGGDYDIYMLNFTSIRAPGLNLTQSTVDLCSSKCDQCFTDTGDWIKLPLPQDDCDGLMSTGINELKELGSLFIDLTAADGKDDITLSFPLLWLAEQYFLGYVSCTGPTGSFALGLPITQYYYTVYDMGNKTVSFVELNLSNEIKAFIDGPELGGTVTRPADNAGCYHQTIGLSLLMFVMSVFLW
jgi:hypothetical protein